LSSEQPVNIEALELFGIGILKQEVPRICKRAKRRTATVRDIRFTD
jgi:histone H3/H4